MSAGALSICPLLNTPSLCSLQFRFHSSVMGHRAVQGRINFSEILARKVSACGARPQCEICSAWLVQSSKNAQAVWETTPKTAISPLKKTRASYLFLLRCTVSNSRVGTFAIKVDAMHLNCGVCNWDGDRTPGEASYLTKLQDCR